MAEGEVRERDPEERRVVPVRGDLRRGVGRGAAVREGRADLLAERHVEEEVRPLDPEEQATSSRPPRASAPRRLPRGPSRGPLRGRRGRGRCRRGGGGRGSPRSRRTPSRPAARTPGRAGAPDGRSRRRPRGSGASRRGPASEARSHARASARWAGSRGRAGASDLLPGDGQRSERAQALGLVDLLVGRHVVAVAEGARAPGVMAARVGEAGRGVEEEDLPPRRRREPCDPVHGEAGTGRCSSRRTHWKRKPQGTSTNAASLPVKRVPGGPFGGARIHHPSERKASRAIDRAAHLGLLEGPHRALQVGLRVAVLQRDEDDLPLPLLPPDFGQDAPDLRVHVLEDGLRPREHLLDGARREVVVGGGPEEESAASPDPGDADPGALERRRVPFQGQAEFPAKSLFWREAVTSRRKTRTRPSGPGGARG